MLQPFFWVLVPLAVGMAEEKQLVYDAGPSTKIDELFFSEFGQNPSCAGYTFEVAPKSVKYAGETKASNTYLFGRTGRPLNEKEKNEQGRNHSGKVPIAIAVGSGVGISSLTMDQLEKIITGKYSNWKEVGVADAEIINTGREGKEALYSILKNK